jgi:hypothetical protein
VIVALFFGLLCGNAWVQVVMHLQSTNPDPPLLTLLQAGAGALAWYLHRVTGHAPRG